jgi:hypothetical protein
MMVIVLVVDDAETASPAAIDTSATVPAIGAVSVTRPRSAVAMATF